VLRTWGFCSSERFSISNTHGVCQGGVLSPIMFTVYLDDLLADLENSGVGCFWNQHFVGAVCYADDVALLAPSPSALRHLLHICTEFAKSHSLVFNAAKTQLICFSQKPCTANLDRVNLVFLDSALTFNSSVTHLGHILRSDLLDDDDIVAVTRDMCRKANCILHTFSCCDPVVKTNLLRSFCLSLYGCGL